MKFHILLLSVYALKYSYEVYIMKKKVKDKIIEEENKIFKNNKNHTLKFFCKITHLTNLLFISYLISTIFKFKNLSINIFSILLPNIIIMASFYWIFLSKKINSLKSFLLFDNLYLHSISAFFVLLDYLSCQCEFKINYLLNLIWGLFCIFMIYLYNNVSKKKMYGLVKVVPGKKMYLKHLIYYLIALIFTIFLLGKLRFTSFN